MIQEHIYSLLLEHLGYAPTSSQERTGKSLTDFIVKANRNAAFVIKGYAGTGKTTLVGSLVKSFTLLKIKSVLMAPTGRAAKVLSSYTGMPAYTIHKKIYRQKSSKDGFGEFAIDVNLHKDTFFIVDEASMITNFSEKALFGSGNLLDDLIRYVYNTNNCRLILIGDTAQLPPVGLDISPALDKQLLESYGLTVHQEELNDVVRQSLDSGILYNATLLRKQMAAKKISRPVFHMNQFKDMERISGHELIEALNRSYDSCGLEDTIVITRSNKNANLYNQGIRNQILFRDEELSAGDYLMVVKNNYYWPGNTAKLDFIANGDIVEIKRLHTYTEMYDYRFVDATVRFIDYKDIEMDVRLMMDTLGIDAAALPREKNKEFFYTVLEDYPEIKNKKKKYDKVRENPYFNALQVKFAYAVTCHKAQGGQWQHVYVDQGYVTEDMIGYEYLRWLYTAITRSSGKLCLVNFHSSFFS